MALPVAAVLMVGIGLFFNVHTAKGLAIEQIYRAIDTVKNIHISSFVPDNQKPVQEVWIARSSGLYIIKTGNECMLWNISDGVKKTKHLDTGTNEQTSLNSDALAGIVTRIHGSLDIMPFDKSSGIPPDAKWSEITDFDHSDGVDNMKVYELKWSEKTLQGLTSQRIWRVFTDASTDLPNKIQWFKQSESDPQPILESIMVLEYPGNEEILAKAEGMSF
jgi:hypothetical protein